MGLRVLLVLLSLLLLGCPHAIYAIPTLLEREPRFPGSETSTSDVDFVPIEVELRSKGHFLIYRLRVDGISLEPGSGPCRRWIFLRGAREARTAQRSFCDEDLVRFQVSAGEPHILELVLESEHTVAKRAYAESGDQLRWRMPIRSERVELSIRPEAGHSYTVVGGDEILDLRSALSPNAPRGRSWDPGEHEPIYYADIEVGSMKIRVLRDGDRRVESETRVHLYSGHMGCEAPFCEGG